MLLFYMVRYLFYTIGDLTYQSPLVILIDYPLQHWLHVSILSYTYIACRVDFVTIFIRNTVSFCETLFCWSYTHSL